MDIPMDIKNLEHYSKQSDISSDLERHTVTLHLNNSMTLATVFMLAV